MVTTALQIIDENFFDDLLGKEFPPAEEIFKIFEIIFIMLNLEPPKDNQEKFWSFCCDFLNNHKTDLGFNFKL